VSRHAHFQRGAPIGLPLLLGRPRHVKLGYFVHCRSRRFSWIHSLDSKRRPAQTARLSDWNAPTGDPLDFGSTQHMRRGRLTVSLCLYKYQYMSSSPERLGWLIKRVQYGHHRELDKRLAPLGVSLVQWNALREIEQNPRCSQRHLAEKTFNSDQAFGTLLKRMQASGLIESRPGIGRANVQTLTAKGRELLNNGQKIMSEVTQRSFSPLTGAERDELAHLLGKILGA
jgi:DNA-binding MarR family transcriptional regulator